MGVPTSAESKRRNSAVGDQSARKVVGYGAGPHVMAEAGAHEGELPSSSRAGSASLRATVYRGDDGMGIPRSKSVTRGSNWS